VLVLIALMMGVASPSETSVNFYQFTWCNNPEDSHLHTRHRENLKSQRLLVGRPERKRELVDTQG
jgi:hypothetical protein